MSRGLVNKSTGERIPSAPGYIVDKVGDLSALHTTAKDKAVSAINEVADAVSAIDDGTSIDSFADVENALTDKTDTDMVAADFDSTASYTAGNYCIYEGKFYKFKNNHSGAWSASDVDEIKIAGELSSLKSGLIDVNSNIASLFTNMHTADAFQGGSVVKYVVLGKVVVFYANITKDQASWTIAYGLPKPYADGLVGYLEDNYEATWPVFIFKDTSDGRLQVRSSSTSIENKPIFGIYVTE